MKRALFLVIVVASLFVVYNLTSSIYFLWQKQSLLEQAKKELAQEKKENEGLKRKLAQAQSPQFIEEQARNKLLLGRPNEQEIFLPRDLLNQATQSAKSKKEANWKLWLRLFLP